jgi:hypothetical protein|tara:strand:+ start:6351 stop:7001 length:651 start_codon:yes stop_codon:yes gene_type:complete
MKNFVIICLFALPFLGTAQTSYEFSAPLPPGGDQLFAPFPEHFGEFKSDRSDIVFELSENGIFTVSTMINSVSRDSVRGSSNYEVKGNYLFGIEGIDSIAIVLQDNRYYFGLRHREEVVGPNSKNVLVRVSYNSYLLNFFENDAYQPCLFSIVSGDLSIQYFDYETDTQVFAKVPTTKQVEINTLKTITLAPERADFADINFMEMFGSERKYKKIE